MIAAVGITLVSLADTIATSSSFGARRGEEVDPNQEMIGIGAANLAAGCLQGFAVSTSGSRTAVVEQAGAKIAAGLGGRRRRSWPRCSCSSTPCWPTSPNRPWPLCSSGRPSRCSISVLARYWRVRKSALVLSVIASLGVIVLGVLQGIVIAIALAVVLYFRRGLAAARRCSGSRSTPSADGTA